MSSPFRWFTKPPMGKPKGPGLGGQATNPMVESDFSLIMSRASGRPEIQDGPFDPAQKGTLRDVSQRLDCSAELQHANAPKE